MQLKFIEMQGFKSFPDKTRINVSPGMTVVVGPNGSGKSNISDAIRWVLGELSSKNMRGSKMEDVIFGGCDSRRPMGFAEVSLIFDNTKGEIPLNVPYDEVCVTRKFYRTGFSEYLINNKKVKLRDITDLFLNTGLGKSGYSIIGQGRISEIISKKSEDRRGIFEEAAGIARYRAQKTAAEKDLALVQENLEKIEIQRNALEGQLAPLEKQSEKAKKYIDLRKEKQKIDIAVWLWEIDSVKSKADDLLQKYEIAQHEYDIAEDEVNSLETRSERLSELIRQNNEKIDSNRNAVRSYADEKHNHQNLVTLMENEIVHIDENIARLTKELSEIRQNGTKSNEITEALNKKRLEAESALEKLKEKISQEEKRLFDIRSAIESNDKNIEDYSALIETKSNELVNTKLELSTLKASKGGNDDKNQDIKSEITAEREKLKENSDKEKEISQTLSTHRSQVDQIIKDISTLEKQRDDINNQRTAIDDRKRATVVEASSVEGQANNLRRMEEHFDGLAIGVKLVMEWSKKGILEGIYGPVSTLMSIDPKYSTAFESALGSSLQNIVCHSDNSAKKAIAKLKAERGGVVTFYPLNTVRPLKLNVDQEKLKKCQGYIDVANNLVSCDTKYKPVIDFLLSRTVVCTDIDSAAIIGKTFDYKFKIVTLDGQLVNSGGSFTGGSRKQSSGILTRRAEIASLTQRAEELKKEVEHLDGKYHALGNDITKLNNDISLLESDLEIARGLVRNAEFESRIISDRGKDIRAQLSKLVSELDELAKTQDLSNQKILDLEALISRTEAELSELRLNLSNEKLLRGKNDQSRSLIIDEKNALDSKFNAISSSLEYTIREIDAANERALSLGITEKEDVSALEEQKAKRISVLQTVQNEKDRSVQLEDLIKKLDAETAALRKDSLTYDSDYAKIKGSIKEKNTHKENCFKVLTRAKEQAEFINNEQDKYLNLLWDEYDLTYAAAEEIPHEKITPENKPGFIAKQNRLKRQMKELGDVNVHAVSEYSRVKEEFEKIDKGYTDLIAAKEKHSGIVRDVEKNMKTMFIETFNKVNENFTVVFSELFGGGRGVLSLTDPENVLESGIEISVAPPGKIIKSLSLLSGGEQVFVAIALFFAILRVSPAPFCLLDEIEAALDEVNVKRFATYAKKFSDKTQFIIISHRRGTMELADTLYGVAMQQRGISTVLSIEVNEVEEKLGLKDIK